MQGYSMCPLILWCNVTSQSIDTEEVIVWSNGDGMVAAISLSWWCHYTGMMVSSSGDSKVHGDNMGPNWGRQDPGGPHVGPWTLLSGAFCIVALCERNPFVIGFSRKGPVMWSFMLPLMLTCAIWSFCTNISVANDLKCNDDHVTSLNALVESYFLL